jgi:hypothetical protein
MIAYNQINHRIEILFELVDERGAVMCQKILNLLLELYS